MAWRFVLLVLMATVFHTPVRVTGVDITVFPTNLNEGSTLTITCREQLVLQEDTLFTVSLDKATNAGGYDSILKYDINVKDPTKDPYLPTWGTNLGDLQQRANFTATFDADRTSLSFEFRIHSVKCGDAASFRCRSIASGTSGDMVSGVQNVTIHGVTQSIKITGAQDCTTFTDPDCARCQNFEDKFGVQPKYARMGQPVLLTCSGLMATPITQNKAIWYKQNLKVQQKEIIDMNTTELVYDSPSPNACSVPGRSTLNYYPQPTDRELRITCEITGGMSVDTVSEEMSICVEGLIYVANTVPPDTESNIDRAGLGGGAIAGIVIGIIALIVVVVVLVYFLWYRRRDSGESYNTREADGRNPPPVAKKPEMHENSTYDTTGDNQDNYYNRNNKYNPGQVNIGMDNDYYHHDNDTTPRGRDPIGSSV